jgi:membrane fusion protein, multidrug efflux system
MRLVLLSSSILLLAACSGESHRAAPVTPAPAVPVQTVAVAAEERPMGYEATGTVRAKTSVTVSAKVMAYVQQVHTRVGERVTAGQTVVTLDTKDFDSNVRRAEAGIAEVRSAMPEADNGIAAAKAQLDLAQATFQRIDQLAQKKSVSSQELDETSARLKAAQAAYEMARSRRAQLDAKLRQADEERRAASVMRDYTKVIASHAGVVTARNVEPGNLASPGVPLLTIESDGGFRLEAQVEESKLSAIRLGQTVEVTLDAIQKTVAGRVAEIVPSADAATRAYTVKIDLPGTKDMHSGMFGRAVFADGSRKVLLIPPTALVERGQVQSAFVVEDGAAHQRLVTVGQKGEVLSGLTAGEKVVSPVPPALTDGARVEVRP